MFKRLQEKWKVSALRVLLIILTFAIGGSLTGYAGRGVTNRISGVKLLQGDVSEAWREGTDEYATVAMRFSLIDVKVDGKVVKAVAQPTKQNWLYVFDRITGQPVWPIEERPYPASDVPGEVAAKTQPYVPYPEPVIADHMPPVSKLADVLSFGECSRWKARIRDEGRYTPPSIRGSISWPATVR